MKVNDPYRGADIIRTHGNPVRGRTSIQIEINRGLHMDEATCERGPRFTALRKQLTDFARAAAVRVRRELAAKVDP